MSFRFFSIRLVRYDVCEATPLTSPLTLDGFQSLFEF